MVAVSRLSTIGALIDNVCSWVFVWYPLAKYSDSAELPPGSKIASLVGLVVTLTVLLPVENKGFPWIFGSGIWSEKIKSPISSLNNSICPTVHSAVPVEFTSFVPGLIHPMWSTLFCNPKSFVSTFKIWLVLEYATAASVLGKGKVVKTSLGSLWGPVLWLGLATLNLILASPETSSFELSTISLTEKLPLSIVMGINLGTAYLVKSVFSMNT